MQATATGFVALAAAWWGLWKLGELWRGHIWGRHGAAIQQAVAASGGQVRPRWLGWRLTYPAGQVDWVGGAWGARTRWRSGAGAGEVEGLRAWEELPR